MYILFEGIDGVGKSTQIDILSKKYKNVITTKEPGATQFGKVLRDILLESKFDLSSRAELLLFLSDRAQHYDEVIRKNKDQIILSDRGFISGMSYALANDSKMSFEEILMLNKFALNGDMADKIVFFKTDERGLRKRLSSRKKFDKIESKGIDYLLIVQEKMIEILGKLSLDFIEVDSCCTKEQITKQIEKFIKL